MTTIFVVFKRNFMPHKEVKEFNSAVEAIKFASKYDGSKMYWEKDNIVYPDEKKQEAVLGKPQTTSCTCATISRLGGRTHGYFTIIKDGGQR